MQIENSVVGAESELDFLRSLDEKLRFAIVDSLKSGRPHLAVALDTARDFVESVLAQEDATSTRIALACVRAEIALETWRAANDVRITTFEYQRAKGFSV